MNHIFYKLANEAWIDAPDGKGYDGKIFSKEKFAELIVRECCFVGEQYADGLFDSKHYAFVNKKIKEHFGVEE